MIEEGEEIFQRHRNMFDMRRNFVNKNQYISTDMKDIIEPKNVKVVLEWMRNYKVRDYCHITRKKVKEQHMQ